MIDLPRKAENVAFGSEHRGLICQGYGLGIALGGDLDGLPETFDATCPTCGRKGTYRKDEIQILQVVRKQ
jgi:hypothetical protein